MVVVESIVIGDECKKANSCFNCRSGAVASYRIAGTKKHGKLCSLHMGACRMRVIPSYQNRKIEVVLLNAMFWYFVNIMNLLDAFGFRISSRREPEYQRKR